MRKAEKARSVRKDCKRNSGYEMIVLEIKDINSKKIHAKWELCSLLGEFCDADNAYMYSIDIEWIFKNNNPGNLIGNLKLIEECVYSIVK